MEGPTTERAAPLGGRVALLTGATAGLGFALAEALAAAGCHIVLNGLDDPDAFEPRRRALETRTGASVAYCPQDVGQSSGVAALIEAALARFGRIDILVNNAVVRHFAPIVALDPADWDSALAVNLSAAFHAIRLVLPGMRERDFGRIFNMVSVYASRGASDRVGYVTTKAALLGLTRAAALENLDRDVTCHAICPGSVLTPGTDSRVRAIMAEQDLTREGAERLFLQGKQPSGRFVSADSVTALVVFLCGPVARDLTGAMLPVDAGWLAS